MRCRFWPEALPLANELSDETPSRDDTEAIDGAGLLNTGERGKSEEPSVELAVGANEPMDGDSCMDGACGTGEAGSSTGEVGGASAGIAAAQEVMSWVTKLGSCGGMCEMDERGCNAGSLTLLTSSELLLGRLGVESFEAEPEEPELELFFLMEKAFLNETGLMRRARAFRISSFSRGRLEISSRGRGVPSGA